MSKLSFIVFFAAALTQAVTTLGQVTNGSFEDPDGLLGQDLPKGSTNIEHWLVTRNFVDYVDAADTFNGYETSFGERTVELNGAEPGGIEQYVDLAQGKRYTLSFQMSGDYTDVLMGEAAERSLHVYVFDVDGKCRLSKLVIHKKNMGETWSRALANMLWKPSGELANLTFESSGKASRHLIVFESLSPDNKGPVIDNVQLTQIN